MTHWMAGKSTGAAALTAMRQVQSLRGRAAAPLTKVLAQALFARHDLAQQSRGVQFLRHPGGAIRRAVTSGSSDCGLGSRSEAEARADRPPFGSRTVHARRVGAESANHLTVPAAPIP